MDSRIWLVKLSGNFITYANKDTPAELLAKQEAAQYQKPHTETTLGVEGRLLWKLKTVHAKLVPANKAPRIRTESSSVEGRSENEDVANESREPADPQPESETNLGLDPLADWVVIDYTYTKFPWSKGESRLIVNIGCQKSLPEGWCFRIKGLKSAEKLESTKDVDVSNVQSSNIPFPFFSCCCWWISPHETFKQEDLWVDLVPYVKTPGKTLHVGTLRCKVTETGMEWVEDSSVRVPANIPSVRDSSEEVEEL